MTDRTAQIEAAFRIAEAEGTAPEQMAHTVMAMAGCTFEELLGCVCSEALDALREIRTYH